MDGIRQELSALGHSDSMYILHLIGKGTSVNFGTLFGTLSISKATLSARLRELEEGGYIATDGLRRRYHEKPYVLTDKGEAVCDMIGAIMGTEGRGFLPDRVYVLRETIPGHTPKYISAWDTASSARKEIAVKMKEHPSYGYDAWALKVNRS